MKKGSKIIFSIIFLAILTLNVNAGSLSIIDTRPLNSTDQIWISCSSVELFSSVGVYKPDGSLEYLYQEVSCPFDNMNNKYSYNYETEGIYSFWQCFQSNCTPPDINSVSPFHQVSVVEYDFQKDIDKLETRQNNLIQKLRALWNCVFNHICS
jgi:hypothetical protein